MLRICAISCLFGSTDPVTAKPKNVSLADGCRHFFTAAPGQVAGLLEKGATLIWQAAQLRCDAREGDPPVNP